MCFFSFGETIQNAEMITMKNGFSKKEMQKKNMTVKSEWGRGRDQTQNKLSEYNKSRQKRQNKLYFFLSHVVFMWCYETERLFYSLNQSKTEYTVCTNHFTCPYRVCLSKYCRKRFTWNSGTPNTRQDWSIWNQVGIFGEQNQKQYSSRRSEQ